jgi:hypothetical protein
VPEGVTYITQAKDGVVFYQPEEIEKFTKPQWDLLKAGLQPIAKWLAQLARRPRGGDAERPSRPKRRRGEEALQRGLTRLDKALDWARDEVLKKAAKSSPSSASPRRTGIGDVSAGLCRQEARRCFQERRGQALLA